MIKFRTLFIGLALVAALMMVSACSSNEPTGQPTAAKETPAQPAAAQQESKPAAGPSPGVVREQRIPIFPTANRYCQGSKIRWKKPVVL